MRSICVKRGKMHVKAPSANKTLFLSYRWGGYLQTCHLKLIGHQNGAKNRGNAGKLRSFSENTFLQIALSVPIRTRHSAANLQGKCVKSYTITFGNEEYLYRVMPSGTLGFLNVRAISKAVFDEDFTFTIPSYLGRKNVPLREWPRLIIVL